jgi:hypothetical protein
LNNIILDITTLQHFAAIDTMEREQPLTKSSSASMRRTSMPLVCYQFSEIFAALDARMQFNDNSIQHHVVLYQRSTSTAMGGGIITTPIRLGTPPDLATALATIIQHNLSAINPRTDVAIFEDLPENAGFTQIALYRTTISSSSDAIVFTLL